jgi:hypothetical protein
MRSVPCQSRDLIEHVTSAKNLRWRMIWRADEVGGGGAEKTIRRKTKNNALRLQINE